MASANQTTPAGAIFRDPVFRCLAGIGLMLVGGALTVLFPILGGWIGGAGFMIHAHAADWSTLRRIWNRVTGDAR